MNTVIRIINEISLTHPFTHLITDKKLILIAIMRLMALFRVGTLRIKRKPWVYKYKLA